jgi:hypothetical protein
LIDLHAFLQQAQQSLSAQPSQSPDPLNPANQAPHATRYAIETILHQENHENQPTDAPPEPSIAHTAPTAHALAQISINLDAGNLHDWHSQHALGQAVVLGA